MSPASASAPCVGVRVLDFSQVLAGPYVGRFFAELGADVIKVESPAGDPSRVIAVRPDWGMSALYTSMNVGKRNVCIDLDRDEGRALALELVKRSQVVLENFRPGVADRLGIGWGAVHAANPAAVMVSISGFGQSSSLGSRGAYAPTIHAAAGILHDHARRLDLPLQAFTDARADLETGLHATIGALAALRVAERTGLGEHIDVALYDSLLATYSETPCELSEPPYVRSEAQPFDAGAHGWLAVAGPPQHVWRVAAAAFGLADPAAEDAEIPTKAKLRHAELERWMQKQPSQSELVARLEAADLPCAPLQTLHEGLTGAHARERGLLVEVDDRRGGKRRIVRMPQRYSRSQAGVPGPAPLRGEHNGAVLRELLGKSDAEIAALEARGVIAHGADPHGR